MRMTFQSTLPTRGSDRLIDASCYKRYNFNPRSPRGGATHRYYDGASPCAFQSTLPTRGSDSYHLAVLDFIYEISIHAPHEGERQP